MPEDTETILESVLPEHPHTLFGRLPLTAELAQHANGALASWYHSLPAASYASL